MIANFEQGRITINTPLRITQDYIGEWQKVPPSERNQLLKLLVACNFYDTSEYSTESAA